MLTKIWGPIFWYNFHIISYSYNNSEKQKYITFFKSMPYLLPCLICNGHFKQILNKHTPEKNITNRNKFIKWLLNIHNSVNKRLNKKTITLAKSKKLYYDNNNILKLDHHKILDFLKISKKYISNGISSIIYFHGSNVLINYCYICPCINCRENMKLLLINQNLEGNNLLKITNKMIDIVSKCPLFNNC